MFFHLLGVFAQWEREEIAERVNASFRTRAKLGKLLNKSAPYGYKVEDAKLILHPDEAPIRRQAYELFLQHRRKHTVAGILNKKGYRTRKGRLWQWAQIRSILADPSAKGVHYFNRMKWFGSWKSSPKPESEWGTLQIEPIVSESLWAQCNQILEEQQKREKRPGKKPVQLFAGLTFCACGQKMYVKANSPKYVCQKCLNKIPVVDLEAIFHDELEAYFTAPERIAQHFEAAHQNIGDKEKLLLSHRSEIEKIRNEMASTHKLYVEGHITPQGFGQFYKPAEERLNQLVAELPKLEAEIDHSKVKSLSAEEVVSEAKALYTRWPKLPVEDRRRIVESIVEKITVGNGEIDITLSHAPSSEELINNQLALPRRSARVRRRR